VTHGIHAPMEHVQPPALEAAIDRARTESKREQLNPPHHAVLAVREARDLPLSSSNFELAPHAVVKSKFGEPGAWHVAIVAGGGAPVARAERRDRACFS
jgi:hypothetical protein